MIQDYSSTQTHSSIYIVDTKQLVEDSRILETLIIILKTKEQKQIILYLLNLLDDRAILQYVEQYEQVLQIIYTEVYRIRNDFQFNFSIIFQSCNPNLIQEKNNQVELLTIQPELTNQKVTLINLLEELSQNKMNLTNEFKQATSIDSYKRGANGGTFDYLHFGHKILISVSLLMVKEFLTIGVTGDIFLQKKINRELIQSYNTRSKVVKNFATLFKPSVYIDISMLNEPAGPTKDGVYELLITTEETQSAINYINNLRAQNSLNSLKNYVVKIIQTETQITKLSSSQIRLYILQKNQITAKQYEFLKIKFGEIVQNQTIKQVYEFYFETQLISFYSEDQRYYHTLSHIYQLLNFYEQIKVHVQNSRLILVAIFFHDIIYQPRLNNNEEESILEFIRFAEQTQDFSEQEINLIKLYIIATKTHQIQNQDDDDLKIFLDLDLSILGQNLEQYLIYARNIRNEYKHFSDSEYRQGRIQVLQRFLKKDNIFLTQQFKSLSEQAKFNLQYEINEQQNQ